VAATLLDDKEYANKLAKMCKDKALTWDQRSETRQNEIATMNQAISVIKGAVANKTSAATVRFMQQGVSVRVVEAVASDDDYMQTLEAATEEQEGPSFLQQASSVLASVRKLRGAPSASLDASMANDGGRAVVVDLLKKGGEHLKSTLLTALATKIAADPFAKVKTLIQELIERLLQEAGNEANQKGWCDKGTADAEQKRDYAAEKVRDFNAEMAELEAVRDQLAEELVELTKAIQEIKDSREKAENERYAERQENLATIEEAQDGKEAINMAIDLLEKFYKTAKKETVDLSLVQNVTGPVEDAPDAGFANGEAYTGAQSESGGILAMLDVMKSDFSRTILVTQQAEEQAQQDHLEFMTESGKSLATKEEAESQKSAQKQEAESKLSEADSNLLSQTDILKTSIEELLELKKVCVDTGMSYEERVSRREDEIAQLNKAMCVLEHYTEYGPEGAAESC